MIGKYPPGRFEATRLSEGLSGRGCMLGQADKGQSSLYQNLINKHFVLIHQWGTKQFS